MFNYWMAGSGPAKAGQDTHLFFKITLLIAGKFQEKNLKFNVKIVCYLFNEKKNHIFCWLWNIFWWLPLCVEKLNMSLVVVVSDV